MDMTDEEKAERLERQKKELELRAKKRNSRLFLFFGSIFEIVETLAVILLLFVFFSFLILRVFQLPEATARTIFQFSDFSEKRTEGLSPRCVRCQGSYSC